MDVENINYSSEFILVVDDEEFVREPIVAMLNRLGFKADAVGTGQEALDKLEEKPYTFLLTDIRMPGLIDGLELIKRSKESHPDVSAIAMTGHSKEFNYVEVVNTGAADFVNKPFSIEELEAKIKRAIIERNIRQELNRLSITDALTGLYNQGHFYARLRSELARAKRQGHNLALILLDLDGFKQYNDSFGHPAGDKLLQTVGKIINGSVREGVDSGYRYGGDEFAVMLIEADATVAEMMSVRIRNGIKEACDLTASAGCAVFYDNLTAEELVGEADQRLYELKERKKNRKGLKRVPRN
ncbi:MAG: diguanylate cyclase [Proteobacteria bacterium]|nr:diguanylate cyclase [Desulfobacterales bacterium]MBL6967677.1 diguanylate cyclase [Desulfobacteraceae bacterium]MBL7171372.1 diguanylate cyclase [Desulfobacteraceae bacterium]MBU0732588.1 diguanylate cyclase [Pseudomonadota bacterium]MBU1903824.1 diguanylate cyclase [Pseudomonadota bacterium]